MRYSDFFLVSSALLILACTVITFQSVRDSRHVAPKPIAHHITHGLDTIVISYGHTNAEAEYNARKVAATIGTFEVLSIEAHDVDTEPPYWVCHMLVRIDMDQPAASSR